MRSVPPVIRDVREAGDWLESLINLEKRPDWPYTRLGLAPIRELLRRLGDPQQGLAAVFGILIPTPVR